VADRKQNPWFVLIRRVLFRVAFAIFILIEVVVWMLLLWGISSLIPEDNFVVGGILVALFFKGLFPIGAVSYLLFQRMTHVLSVLSESERWLAERQDADPRRIKRRKLLRRWAVWTPALSVLFFCLFLDRTLPPLTHILHPNYGRLGAYRVSLPLDWTVIFGEPDPGGKRDRSYFYANRWRGMLRSGIDEYIGRKPSMTSSSLSCFSSRPDEFNGFSSSANPSRPVATGTYSMDNVTLTCEESVSRYPGSADEARVVSCVTPKRDFYCTLSLGGDEEVSEFYGVVQGIKRTK